MTTEVFGRKYSLKVGSIPTLVTDNAVSTTIDLSNLDGGVTAGILRANSEQGGYRDYVTAPTSSTAIEITELHIEATVELGTNSKSNISGATVKIKIYNLSKNSQKRIKADDSVILRAGYEQDTELPLIFAAQVISVKTRKQGVNTITTITCGDSFTLRKNLRVSKSFPRGTTYRTVIQFMLDQAADYGVPTGEFFVADFNPTGTAQTRNLEDEVRLELQVNRSYNPAKGPPLSRVNKTLESGYGVVGLLFGELARVCDTIDYRVYLLHGSLYVEPIEFRIRRTVVSVTGDSLIGSIREEDDSSTKLSGDSLNQKSITLKVPLNGRITTTSLLKVSSILENDLSGSYDVVSLKHKLSLESGEWVTEVSGKRII